MIQYRPRDAIASRLGIYEGPLSAAWTVVLEDWCHRERKWDDYRPGDGPSCENFRNPMLWEPDDARDNLAKLFVHVGSDSWEGRFLRSQKLRKWADLDKPRQVPGWQPKNFAAYTWFGDNVRGRELQRPGPNECHPDALSVFAGGLRFARYFGRWEYWLQYGYPHDASSWMFTIRQDRREGREQFALRVNAWMDEYLVAEEFSGAHRRKCYEARWRRIASGCGDVFWYDCGVDRERLVDELAASKHNHGIPLTPRRAKVLLGWAKKARTS